MSFFETFAGYFGKKIADEVFTRFRDEVFQKLGGEYRRVEERLDRIEDAIEQSRLADLRAGLRHWGLNDFELARRKFVEAEAQDPEAPIPKYWLGLALQRLGIAQSKPEYLEAGDRCLDEAFKSNPALFSFLLPKDAPSLTIKSDELLSVDVPSEQLLQLLGKSSAAANMQDFLFGNRQCAAVRRASATMGALLCEIQFGSTMRQPRLTILASLDISNKKWTWAVPLVGVVSTVDDWEFLYATNRHPALS